MLPMIVTCLRPCLWDNTGHQVVSNCLWVQGPIFLLAL
jgi:hypothetical protein